MRQTRATPGKARVSRFTPNEASRPLRASLAQKRQKIAPVLQAVFHHEIQTSEEGDFPLQWSPVEKNSRKLILILLSYELGSIFFAVQSFRFLGMGTYIGVPFRFTQDSMLTPILLPLENLRFFRCVGFWLWRSGKNHSIAYIAYYYQDTEIMILIIIKKLFFLTLTLLFERFSARHQELRKYRTIKSSPPVYPAYLIMWPSVPNC